MVEFLKTTEIELWCLERYGSFQSKATKKKGRVG